MTIADVLNDPENMIAEFFGTILSEKEKKHLDSYKNKKHTCVQITDNYMDYDNGKLYAVWYAITNENKHVIVGMPTEQGTKGMFTSISSYVHYIVKRLNEMKDNFISITAEGKNYIVLSNGTCIASDMMLDNCICGGPYDLVFYIGIDSMTDEQYKQFTMCYIPVICGTPKTKVILMYEKNNRPIFDSLK